MDKKISPDENSFGRLPQEIQDTIFSYLPLLERVSCTSVSKDWRSSILNSPKTWYRLSDEPHGLYVLYQILSNYQQYIRRTDVREIVLTGESNSLQNDQIPTINLNMERLMGFLELLSCRSIEKAVLLAQSYSEAWLGKFKAVAGNSLTHLVLACCLPRQTNMTQALVTFIVNHFPNMHYLNLSLSKQLYGIGNDNIVHNPQLSNGQSHNSLKTMILQIEASLNNTALFPAFSNYIVPRLPKLRHISFNARAFPSKDSLNQFYKNLFTYCKELESLDSGWYPIYISPWEKIPDSLQQMSFDHIPRAEGLKRFQIIPKSKADHVLLQLRSIVPECNASLEEITIHDLDDIQLNYLTTFKFPRLKKFMCSAEILSEQSHRLPASLVPFLLDNGRQLEYIELKYIEINDVLLDVLSTCSILQILKLTYCRAVTQKMLNGFRAHNNATIIQKYM